jgi:cell division protein YceG involved in septum cleavage
MAWEEYREGLKRESINDLLTMASFIRAELERRGASQAWNAVGK